ncbi:MAG: DUF2232 domain-containing protein [Spirochaetales bacterium]|nr:DUF2232 domain-containing protein [Spirochaetales bacterium]
MLIFSALTAASILIFQISVVFFLMVIPLFIIQQRYGFMYLSMAGLFVTLVIVIETIIRGAGIEGSNLRHFLIVAELVYPLSIIGGVIGLSWLRKRTLYSLMAASAAFAVISFPVIMYYSGNEEIVNLLKNQILFVSDMFRDTVTASDSFESSVLIKELQPDLIIESTLKLVFRNYIFAYFIMLAVGWFVADSIDRRRKKKQQFKLVNFIVPELMIWPLIIVLAGVLLDVFFGMSWIGYIMWNSTFIMIFIYGLHGIGLVKYLLGRYKVPGSGRRLIAISVFVVLLMPGLNLVILIGVPVLGVSELWIRYRSEGESYENYS